MSNDQIIKDGKEAFKLSSEAEDHNRKEALDDLKFARLGEQWPTEIKKQRDTDGRPCLTVNRLPSFIRQVVNDGRMNRPQLKIHPIGSGADVQTANVLDGLVRSIQYNSHADAAYDTALEFSVSMGWGYFRVDIDYAHDDSFEKDLVIRRVSDPFSIFGDPNSTAPDSSDWNSAFEIRHLTKKQFQAQYKGAQEVDWDRSGYADLPPPWMAEDEIMVASWWTREEVERQIVRVVNPQTSEEMVVDAEKFAPAKDAFAALGLQVADSRPTKSWQVLQRVMTGAEVLEETPWAGQYIPLIPVYGDEVIVQGKRYWRSMVRDAKDPQRMLNYWRTTSTELVALAPRAPYIGRKGAFEYDSAKWATINSQNWPFVEFDGPEPPQRQPFDGPPAGALQEALNANEDLKQVMGIFDPSLGAQGNETSGRAILARQRQGDRGTFHFADNLTRAIAHCGRILVDLIPSVYTEERIIRVTQPDGSQQDQVINQRQADGKILFDLSIGKYDVVVDAGPSYETRRQEAAAEMLELLRAYPQAAPMIGDLLVKNLDWPGAEEIAQRMQAAMAQQQGGQQQQQQAEQQHQLALEQIKAQGVQGAEQIKAQTTKDVEQFKAGVQVWMQTQIQALQQKQVTEQNAIEAQRDLIQHQRDTEAELLLNKMDNLTRIVTAMIAASKAQPADPAALTAEVDAE